MALTAPYQQHRFLGIFANDAAALAWLQAQHWDTTKNGAGAPELDMVYKDSALNVHKYWDGAAWQIFASREWTTALVVSGVNWREVLLEDIQLINGAAGGVSPALLLSVTGLPTATDTLTLSDGVVTEVFTFRAAVAAPFDIAIGGTVAACMANIVTAILADSTVWTAAVSQGLDRFFAGAYPTQVVIARATATAGDDRIFATLTGAGAIQMVEFATALRDNYDFAAGTELAIPAADPAAKRSGFGRLFAGLIAGETHNVLSPDHGYTWDADAQAWNRTLTIGPEVLQNAGNPNGVVDGVIGDVCIDTVGNFYYGNTTGTNVGWVVLG